MKKTSFIYLIAVSIVFFTANQLFADTHISTQSHQAQITSVRAVPYKSGNDFEYFTSHSSVHDGTLMFVMESMTEVLGRVMSCRTCRKGMEPPKWGDIIHYTIGNLVVLDEFDGDWVPKDKPWCTERTTVLLPIKVEVLKKEDTEV